MCSSVQLVKLKFQVMILEFSIHRWLKFWDDFVENGGTWIRVSKIYRIEEWNWMVEAWHAKVIKRAEVQSKKCVRYFGDSKKGHWLNQMFYGGIVEDMV